MGLSLLSLLFKAIQWLLKGNWKWWAAAILTLILGGILTFRFYAAGETKAENEALRFELQATQKQLALQQQRFAEIQQQNSAYAQEVEAQSQQFQHQQEYLYALLAQENNRLCLSDDVIRVLNRAITSNSTAGDDLSTTLPTGSATLPAVKGTRERAK